jgi:tetratricopeptide (TPR) repeat protein
VSRKESFTITHLEEIPRPWIFSKTIPPAGDSIYPYLAAWQHFNSGRFKKAHSLFQTALSLRPESNEYAAGLARALFALEDYSRAEEVLKSLVRSVQEPSFDILYMLANSRQKMGKYDQAISVLEEMRLRFGSNIEILNLLGICYFQEGQLEKALDVWEKSLEIEPDQPHLSDSIKAIKETR